MSNSLRAHRNMCESPICDRCSFYSETTDHVIRSCPKARYIWRIFISYGNLKVVSDLQTHDWLKVNLVDEGDEQVGDLPRKYLFSSIVWHIWKERKNKVINGEEPNTAKLCYQIRSFAREVAFSFSLNSQSSLTKERRLISWSYPAAGKIKLNTDGSVKEECGRYGYGRVIRDDKGQWLGGYYGKLNQCNSLEAELHAILVGLELIRSDQRNTVIVESDSSVAVNLAKAPRDEGHPMAVRSDS